MCVVYAVSVCVPICVWICDIEQKRVYCREVLKARWCEPTLSVVDVRIGDEDGSGDSAYRFGPTRFSVIPRSAVGNVSIRFVPDQNADHLIAALRYAMATASFASFDSRGAAQTANEHLAAVEA